MNYLVSHVTAYSSAEVTETIGSEVLHNRQEMHENASRAGSWVFHSGLDINDGSLLFTALT